MPRARPDRMTRTAVQPDVPSGDMAYACVALLAPLMRSDCRRNGSRFVALNPKDRGYRHLKGLLFRLRERIDRREGSL